MSIKNDGYLGLQNTPSDGGETPSFYNRNQNISLSASHGRHFLSTSSTSSKSEDDSTNNSSISTSENQQRKSDHHYCVELVQTRDKEAYLCGLLMPAHCRESYFAIRAFNVELASVKDGGGLFGSRRRGQQEQTDNDLAGDSNIASKLRMQWWRDAVADIYNTSSPTTKNDHNTRGVSGTLLTSKMLTASRKHNPVVRALNRAVHESNLTRRFLDRMVDARDLDLDLEQMLQLQDLVQYSEDTQSSLLYLSLESLGISEDVVIDSQTDIVASNVGIGLGVLNAIRSTVYRASTMGEIPIPADLMEKYDVPKRYLYNPPNVTLENGKEYSNENDQIADEALQKVIKEMASVAANYLSRARSMQGQVPKEARLSLIPAVIGLNYLKKLEKANYDLFHPDMLVTNDSLSTRLENLSFTFLLGRAWLTGIF